MSQITILGIPAAALKRLDERATATNCGRDELAAAAFLAGLDLLESATAAKPEPKPDTTTPSPRRRKRKERT